jgi:hypothetical protein
VTVLGEEMVDFSSAGPLQGSRSHYVGALGLLWKRMMASSEATTIENVSKPE